MKLKFIFFAICILYSFPSCTNYQFDCKLEKDKNAFFEKLERKIKKEGIKNSSNKIESIGWASDGYQFSYRKLPKSKEIISVHQDELFYWLIKNNGKWQPKVSIETKCYSMEMGLKIKKKSEEHFCHTLSNFKF